MAASTAHRRTSGPELDPDEREAIALAETLRADALIIDDKIGRKEASEVTCDWNSARLGRCGGGRLGWPAQCASAITSFRVLSRRQALAIST